MAMKEIDNYSSDELSCNEEEGLLFAEESSSDKDLVNSIPVNDEFSSISNIAVNEMCTLHRAILKGKDKKVLRYLSRKKNQHKINKQDQNGRYVNTIEGVSNFM